MFVPSLCRTVVPVLILPNPRGPDSLRFNMASQGLFGHAGRSSSKNLVEFRAGKMTMKGSTVTPDKRKGLVYIYQSDDSLMHFCWKDRGTGTVEDVRKM